MGQRHNRKCKRTRSRHTNGPLDSGTASLPLADFGPSTLSKSLGWPSPRQRGSIKAYTENITQPLAPLLMARESSAARERRIFGGSEDDDVGFDLRGPMLDVVLGLFSNVDYDDSALC